MTFKQGISGNPAGRRAGSGHRQKLFNNLVIPHKEQLVETAIDLALKGNEAMLRLFLERMLPAKPKDEPIASVGSLEGALVAQGEKILMCLTAGELTISEGMALLNAISIQNKLIVTDEMIKRIEQLEEHCHAEYRKSR